MSNILNALGRYKLFKYALCGIVSLAFLCLATVVLNKLMGISFLLASSAAYYLSLFLDFYLQKNFTFKNYDYCYVNLGKQGVLFFTARIISGGLYTLLLKILHQPEMGATSYFLAPAITLAIIGLINFSFDNYITYRHYKNISPKNIRRIYIKAQTSIKSGLCCAWMVIKERRKHEKN